MAYEQIPTAILEEIASTCGLSTSAIEDVYGCTPLQAGLMAESVGQHGAPVYHFTFSIAESIDMERFCTSLAQLASQRDMLRARIVDCELGLMQVITNEHHIVAPEAQSEEEYLRQQEEQLSHFGDPLFRVATIGRSLILTAHHAVFDHFSLAAVMEDTLDLYHGRSAKPRPSFKHFVDYYQAIDGAKAREFWKGRLEGSSGTYPTVNGKHVPTKSALLSEELQLDEKGRNVSQALLPSYIELAWAVATSFYTGSEQIAYGFVASGRGAASSNFADTMGPTLALVPVQVTVRGEATIEDLLKERTLDRKQLISDPALHWGLSNIRSVIEDARSACEFQSVVNIRSSTVEGHQTDELKLKEARRPPPRQCVELNFDLHPRKIDIEARFDPEMLQERQMHRILRQTSHIFQALITCPAKQKINNVEALNFEDKLEILTWNSASITPSVDKSLVELFEEQESTHASSPAIDAHDGTLTYGELDALSNKLAAELKWQGVSPEDIVPFIFEKSLWTTVAVLAVLKAGGTCVPIEPSWPFSRKEYIVRTTAAKVLLTSAQEHDAANGLAQKVLTVDHDAMSLLAEPNSTQETSAAANQLAFVMFTSGSTGPPKGVMLEHSNIASMIAAFKREVELPSKARVLQFAAHVWDDFLLDTFSALLTGGCLCVPSQEDRLTNLASFMRKNRIDSAVLTPTVTKLLSPADVPELKILMNGGEPVDAQAARTWGSALRFFNSWGSCENTSVATSQRLTPSSTFETSIGHPVGCAVWIVRKNNIKELAPIGAEGELVIEGPNIARGYLADEAKTEATFIAPPAWAPMRRKAMKIPRRFFRTGDLGRYNADGSIAFVGRQDDQVKLRGQRFTLGEVERVLLRYQASSHHGTSGIIPYIQDILAVIHESTSGRRDLVAVFSVKRDGESNAEPLKLVTEPWPHGSQIWRYAQSELPEYMVPTVWFVLEKMPQTASGKLDRTAVREWLKSEEEATGRNLREHTAALCLSESSALEETARPLTDGEQLLVKLWSTVLRLPASSISAGANWVQSGGDSISAMRLSSAAHKAGLALSVKAIVSNPFLADMAKAASSSAEGDSNGQIPPKGEDTPVISQEQLASATTHRGYLRQDNIESIARVTETQAWMLAWSKLCSDTFKAQFTLRLSKELDGQKLKTACIQIFKHHAILRTLLVPIASDLYQVVLKIPPVAQVIERGVGKQSDQYDELTKLLPTISLSTGGEGCQELTISIYHFLYDGLSFSNILHDLVTAYESGTLECRPEFHRWIASTEQMDHEAATAFWSDLLQGSSMTLLGRPGPQQPGVSRRLSSKRVDGKNVRLESGSMGGSLKVAWALLLSLALGVEDIVFGEVNANRTSDFLHIEQVCGPCLSVLPVRARLDQSATIASLVKELDAQLHSTIPHRHTGVRSIAQDSTVWPVPRFGSIVVIQDSETEPSNFKIGNADATFGGICELGDSSDVWLNVLPGKENVDIQLVYSQQRLSQAQAEWLRDGLVRILERLPHIENATIRDCGKILKKMGQFPKREAIEALRTERQANGTETPTEKSSDLV